MQLYVVLFHYNSFRLLTLGLMLHHARCNKVELLGGENHSRQTPTILSIGYWSFLTTDYKAVITIVYIVVAKKLLQLHLNKMPYQHQYKNVATLNHLICCNLWANSLSRVILYVFMMFLFRFSNVTYSGWNLSTIIRFIVIKCWTYRLKPIYVTDSPGFFYREVNIFYFEVIISTNTGYIDIHFAKIFMSPIRMSCKTCGYPFPVIRLKCVFVQYFCLWHE